MDPGGDLVGPGLGLDRHRREPVLDRDQAGDLFALEMRGATGRPDTFDIDPCAALNAVEVVLGDRVRSRIKRREVGIVDLMAAQAHQMPAETRGYFEPVGNVFIQPGQQEGQL
jgi:hypothetical protein